MDANGQIFFRQKIIKMKYKLAMLSDGSGLGLTITLTLVIPEIDNIAEISIFFVGLAFQCTCFTKLSPIH